ncbi:hypothetical protein [Parashewanella tropica]|uniref:hypothetical protein n=1 Tax=Parashewanella tropica TaxID=2547970 RepID=UPI0010592EA3|nr:hypothetical protein [Parashewanella tropica]
MALTRKQWNNIIILASAAMIGTLTLLHNKTEKVPEGALPLFDQHTALQQLQLGDYTLIHEDNHWRCMPSFDQCQTWRQAWHQLRISPIASPTLSDDQHERLTIIVKQSPQPLQWRYYIADGLLQSASGQWYKIPPSLQHSLLPSRLTQK